MTEPQVAMVMMGSFVASILLGFPIAFTLIAMGAVQLTAEDLLEIDPESEMVDDLLGKDPWFGRGHP